MIERLKELLATANNLPWDADDAPMIKSVGLVDPERPSRGREIIAQAFGNNADLVVEAVNALPRLLEIADAVKRASDAVPGSFEDDLAMSAACEALAKLETP